MLYIMISVLLFNVAVLFFFWIQTTPKTFAIHKFEYDYETWYKVSKNGTFIGPDFQSARSAKRFIRHLQCYQ